VSELQRRAVAAALGGLLLGAAVAGAAPAPAKPAQTDGSAEAGKPLDVWDKFGVVEFTDGQRAPDFALKTLDGRTVTLADFHGKAVAINFWATWCGPCEWEMPSMEKLHRKYQGRPFALLAVSVDTGAADVFVRPYAKGMGLTLPVILDSTLQTSRSYRVRGLPTTFFVSHDGALLGQIHGPRDWTTPEALAFIDYLIGRIR
jgi:thiol-disulfide isomerase/thioredoxin